MQITIEDFKNIIFVELLAHKNNKVKLNKMYDKYKDLSYEKMRKSKMNKFSLIKKASITKTIDYKKAIGLVEIFNEYREMLPKEKEVDKDGKGMVFKFLDEFADIIFGSYKHLEESLLTLNYEKVGKEILKASKLSIFDIEFTILSLLLMTDEEEFQRVFGESLYVQLKELIFRRVEDRNLELEEKFKDEETIKERNKYLPTKKFTDLFSLKRKIDEEIKSDYKREQVGQIMIMIERLSEINGIDIEEISFEHFIEKKEINYIFSLLPSSKLESGYSELYVFLSFLITFLCKELNKSKELFFENNDEIFELEKKTAKKEELNFREKIEGLEKALEQKEVEMSKLRKAYEKTLLEIEKENKETVEKLEDIINSFEKTDEENDGRIDENIKYEKESSITQIDIKNEADFILDDEIYVVGGYNNLIERFKRNFPNLIWAEKVTQKLEGKKVFFLTSYSSHTDLFKLNSLNIETMFIKSRGSVLMLLEMKKLLGEKHGEKSL